MEPQGAALNRMEPHGAAWCRIEPHGGLLLIIILLRVLIVLTCSNWLNITNQKGIVK